MIDEDLINLMTESTPKLNPLLANGLACSQLTYTEKYIDSVWQSVMKDFPPGLVYLGGKRCTPMEEYNEATRRRSNRTQSKRSSRRTYETARKDLFMVKYEFMYNGVKLPPKYIYLPYVGPGGSIHITGVKNYISPVLTDRVISINQNSIFMRLLRDKLTFNRKSYSFVINPYSGGQREDAHVIYSPIYHNKSEIKRVKPIVTAETCTVHYLLCKYGFTEAFRRFAGVVPVIGEDLNIDQYPESDWVICKTFWTNIVAPRGVNSRRNKEPYFPTKIMLAIPKDKYTPMVKAMVAGFYYVVDLFPTQMHAGYVESEALWTKLLGSILLPSDTSAGKLYEKMTNHTNSLNEYIDTIIQHKLSEINIDVKDIYEFFAVITENFSSWLIRSSSKINSLYDKELQVPYWTLYSITNAIVIFLYKVKAAVAKKPLSENELKTIMNSTLRARLIYSLNKENGEVGNHNYSGDNKAFKITSIMIPQSDAIKSAKKSKGRGSISDPSKKLHVSVAEVASYSGMPKTDPSGRSRLNLHTMIDPKGMIVRNPKFIELLEDVQSIMNNTKHSDEIDEEDTLDIESSSVSEDEITDTEEYIDDEYSSDE